MIGLALYQPEIPPNTGNLMRLCANTGAELHLIHPLGFSLEERALRRAGLDYRDQATLIEHADWPAFLAATAGRRLLAFSTRGRTRYDTVSYRLDDLLLFGPETRGLPETLLADLPPPQRLYLPMQAGSRSLNLSNTAAIALYTAWQSLGFPGAGSR
jgi:tRNA (cytidine/uridine-2'-O-)-methyltransferase